MHESVRSGVHVHINVQDLNPRELFNFITCYIIMEELLVKYCGDDREGNLFCLRAIDAEFLIISLVDAIISENLSMLNTDDLRYSSMNVKALCTYGSLEFRAMRGTADMDTIKNWANLLLHIKDKSIEFGSPKDIIAMFSGDTTDSFVHHILGPYGNLFNEWDSSEALLRGMRLAQDVAYAVDDWDVFLQYGEKKAKKKHTSDTIEALLAAQRILNTETPMRRAPDFAMPVFFSDDAVEDPEEDDEEFEEDGDEDF